MLQEHFSNIESSFLSLLSGLTYHSDISLLFLELALILETLVAP